MTKQDPDICEIYIIGNSVNDKFYAGQSWPGTQQRFNHHKNDKSGDCPKLFNAMNCHGRENFYVIHVATIKTKNQKEVDDLEDAVILQYNCIENGYNIRRGGATGKLTEEDKLSKSIAAIERWQKLKEESESTNTKHYMQGENNPMFGKTHTEEARQKITEATTGRIVSEEQRQKASERFSGEGNPMFGIPSPMTGKKHSEETINKQSEIAKERWSKIRSGEIEMPNRSNNAYCGEDNPFFGRTHTEEAKEKIRVANTGREKTPEELEKLRIASTGKIHTEEAKQKISKANKGRKRTEEQNKALSKALKGIGKGIPKSEESKRKNAEAHRHPLSPETLAKCKATREKNKALKILAAKMQKFYSSTQYYNVEPGQIKNLQIQSFRYLNNKGS